MLVAVNGAMAQWVPQNSETDAELKSVFFLNDDTGYAVGGFNDCSEGTGYILKTIDGGDNWIDATSIASHMLQSVYFTDLSTGYLSGFGNIYKTIDGGDTWNVMFSLGGYRFRSIYFSDINKGYAVGCDEWEPVGGVILKTSDGGITWNNTGAMPQWAIHFPDVYTGYSVGFGTIYKTIDGGSTWLLILSLEPSGETFTSVYFTNENNGFAVTTYGSIYKTSDGGTTWTNQTYSTPLSSVYFPDPSIGYIVGNGGTILKTVDGGATWFNQSSGTSNDLYSVFFANTNTGYAVGDSGTIIKTTNGGTTGLNESDIKLRLINIYPTPSNNIITIETTLLSRETYLSILNINGQKLIERMINVNKIQIDISNLPSGIYFVKLQNRNTIEIRKMIKQ